jgi:hypothetical protein
MKIDLREIVWIEFICVGKESAAGTCEHRALGFHKILGKY